MGSYERVPRPLYGERRLFQDARAPEARELYPTLQHPENSQSRVFESGIWSLESEEPANVLYSEKGGRTAVGPSPPTVRQRSDSHKISHDKPWIGPLMIP